MLSFSGSSVEVELHTAAAHMTFCDNNLSQIILCFPL